MASKHYSFVQRSIHSLLRSLPTSTYGKLAILQDLLLHQSREWSKIPIKLPHFLPKPHQKSHFLAIWWQIYLPDSKLADLLLHTIGENNQLPNHCAKASVTIEKVQKKLVIEWNNGFIESEIFRGEDLEDVDSADNMDGCVAASSTSSSTSSSSSSSSENSRSSHGEYVNHRFLIYVSIFILWLNTSHKEAGIELLHVLPFTIIMWSQKVDWAKTPIGYRLIQYNKHTKWYYIVLYTLGSPGQLASWLVGWSIHWVYLSSIRNSAC